MPTPKEIDSKSDALIAKLLSEDDDTGQPEPDAIDAGVIGDFAKAGGAKDHPKPGPDSSPKGYNGWKNYQTWNVALWIGNDEGLYHLARSCKNYEEFAETMREMGITETPDKVAYNDSNLDIAALDDDIKELRGDDGEEEILNAGDSEDDDGEDEFDEPLVKLTPDEDESDNDQYETGEGKKHSSLDSAKAHAEDVFGSTGVVTSIEKREGKKKDSKSKETKGEDKKPSKKKDSKEKPKAKKKEKSEEDGLPDPEK